MACIWSLPFVLLICVIPLFCISIWHLFAAICILFPLFPCFLWFHLTVLHISFKTFMSASFLWPRLVPNILPHFVNTLLSRAPYTVIYLTFYLSSRLASWWSVCTVSCINRVYCMTATVIRATHFISEPVANLNLSRAICVQFPFVK
jgi:hypothetical protein